MKRSIYISFSLLSIIVILSCSSCSNKCKKKQPVTLTTTGTVTSVSISTENPMSTEDTLSTENFTLTPIPIEPPEEISELQAGFEDLPELIQKVMRDEVKFVDSEQKETFSILSYTLETISEEKVYVDWGDYIVADVDQDGENELVIYINDIEHPDSVNIQARVLDLQEDTVYCYSYPYRGVLRVYKDGAMEGSSGAADNIIYTAKYDKTEKKEIRVVESISHNGKVDYYIGDKQVTEKEYYEFLKKYPYEEHLKWMEGHFQDKVNSIAE